LCVSATKYPEVHPLTLRPKPAPEPKDVFSSEPRHLDYCRCCLQRCSWPLGQRGIPNCRRLYSQC
jgi:hypothetical protein